MCLPFTGSRVEREWKHLGLSCAVVVNGEAGHRCGYVRVPPGHILHGKPYDEPDVAIHGGLTFAEEEPCTEHEDGQGWWFGFDCAHYGDARFDPCANLEELPEQTRRMLAIERTSPFFDSGHYWTKTEVEIETESLAEQLARA
jgi:hypothetical protein